MPTLRRIHYLLTTGAKRRLRDVVLHSRRDNRFTLREDVARRYLSGEGIEIGPFVWPLRVPPGARVRTVDFKSREELIEANRGTVTNIDSIPEIDVVDNAEELSTFADESLDFVIASHVVEHLEDPLGGLANWLRVLRPAGVLYIGVPDAVQSFDARRPRTSVAHLLRDHAEGPGVSRQGHYEEWARYIEGVGEDGVAERAAAFAREDARHHFHVWELGGFLEFLGASGLPCVVEFAQRSIEEFVVVVRKSDGGES